jgi:hypothetical protein
MDDMMKMLKGCGKPIEGKEKESKMAVIHELMKAMNALMSEEHENSESPDSEMNEHGQKVMVQAGNPRDLEKGLEMAKQVVSKDPSKVSPEMSPDMMDEDELDEDYV